MLSHPRLWQGGGAVAIQPCLDIAAIEQALEQKLAEFVTNAITGVSTARHKPER